MGCWKCGEPTVGGACSVCGCLESSRLPALSENGRMLRYVYDKFGSRRTLTEDGLFVRCLADMLPDEVELRRALTKAFDAGAGRALYAILAANMPLTDASYQGVVQIMRQVGIGDEDGRNMLAALCEMIGCVAPTIAVHDPMPVTPQNGTNQSGHHQISWDSQFQTVPPRPVVRPVAQPVKQPVVQPAVQTSQTIIAQLANVVLADATHGINAMKSNGQTGVLFLRQDGVAMHFYVSKFGLSKKRAYHDHPDIFIPMGAIARLIPHDSGLSFDFTLVLKDGVRFQTIASTYAYNRKDARAFFTALQSLIP